MEGLRQPKNDDLEAGIFNFCELTQELILRTVVAVQLYVSPDVFSASVSRGSGVYTPLSSRTPAVWHGIVLRGARTSGAPEAVASGL